MITKGATSGEGRGGLKVVSTFVWVRPDSEAKAKVERDQICPGKDEVSEEELLFMKPQSGLRVFKCGPCNSISKTRAEHREAIQ